jgi:acetoin utilization deacetylase AcuC-like enzyme
MKVHYSDRMVAEAGSYSPSAGKPAAVVASWRRLAPALELVAPEPLTAAQLALAHDRDYVDGVLSLRLPNGFGNRLPGVAASLPYTCGAMVAAAREALRNGAVGIAPVSGFHHAGWDEGGGYCTFNGLVVAAQVLRQEAAVGRVSILDADHHYGNGTADIIQRLSLDWIEHVTLGAEYTEPGDAARFFRDLPGILARFRGCDLLLYQAGADPHLDDPLGGWLDDRQLRQRDRRVFDFARAAGLPIAWNLAGGYQQPLRKVLDIHDHTLRECMAVFEPCAASA